MRAVYQDGRKSNGGASRQAHGVPGTNSGKPIFIPGPTTRVGPWRYYRQQGGGGCGVTLGRGRAVRDGLGQFIALSPEVRGREWRAKADCRKLPGVGGQCSSLMGRL